MERREYVFPADKRPRSSPPSSAAAVPVVDLGSDEPDRIVKQIMDAGRELGIFQVVNHGVPEQVIREMMSSAEEFFRLPAKEKMALYSTDSKKLPHEPRQRPGEEASFSTGGTASSLAWLLPVRAVQATMEVNLGHPMEVVSNGLLRAGEHRVVTNASAARTSLATFVMPAMGCAVAAAAVSVAGGEAPMYRAFTYQEFLGEYMAATGDRDAVQNNKD